MRRPHFPQDCSRNRNFGIRSLGTLVAVILIGGSSLWADGPLATVAAPVPADETPLILPADETPHPELLHTTRFLGSQSCGASACHGNPRRDNLVSSAYHFVMDRDPHQRAGTVLYEERSRKMAERLKLGVPPWKAQECLACHSPGALNANDHTLVSALIADGIGCESCHGPAEQWLAAHRGGAWKFDDIWPAARKAETGFKNTKDLVARANVCADCHVGKPGQVVDHDLIAAGHPRLNFEFAAYQALYPKHWRTSDDRQRTPSADTSGTTRSSTFESTSWLVGQLVTADHELELLLSRAAQPEKAWPELSQFDCYACHHDLQNQSWQQLRAGTHRPGEITWGIWSLGLLETLPPELSLLTADNFRKESEALRQHLRTLKARPETIHSPATRLRAEIATALQNLPSQRLDAATLGRAQNQLLDARQSLVSQGWDQTTHLYLATVALQNGAREAHGLTAGAPGSEDATLLKIRGMLSFDPASPLPAPFEISDSPRYGTATPAEILQAFEDYLQTRPRLEAAVPAHAIPSSAEFSPLLLRRQ